MAKAKAKAKGKTKEAAPTNFAANLKDHLLLKPKLSSRDKKILSIIDGPQNDKRAKKLSRWEAHARVEAGVSPVGAIDWSKIDWAKLIESILAIIALFL